MSKTKQQRIEYWNIMDRYDRFIVREDNLADAKDCRDDWNRPGSYAPSAPYYIDHVVEVKTTCRVKG